MLNFLLAFVGDGNRIPTVTSFRSIIFRSFVTGFSPLLAVRSVACHYFTPEDASSALLPVQEGIAMSILILCEATARAYSRLNKAGGAS